MLLFNRLGSRPFPSLWVEPAAWTQGFASYSQSDGLWLRVRTQEKGTDPANVSAQMLMKTF